MLARSVSRGIRVCVTGKRGLLNLSRNSLTFASLPLRRQQQLIPRAMIHWAADSKPSSDETDLFASQTELEEGDDSASLSGQFQIPRAEFRELQKAARKFFAGNS